MKRSADGLQATTLFPEVSPLEPREKMNITHIRSPQNGSTPILPQVVSPETMTFFICLTITFCFLASSANAYILVLSRWIKGTYGTVLKLTFGLAAADCWTSLIMGISFIFYTTPVLSHVSFGNCVLLLFEIFRLGSIFTSILHLLMMAINHYQSIDVRQTVGMKLSGRLLTNLMLLAWIIPTLTFFVVFWVIPGQGFNSLLSKNTTAVCTHTFMSQITYRSVIYVSLLLPVLVMIGLYLCMGQTLYVLEKQFQRQNRRSRSVHMKQKMLLTIILMIGSFIVGWLPSGTWLMFTASESIFSVRIKSKPILLFSVSVLVNFLMVVKLLVNPIIYALRIPEIHEACKQPFSKNRHSVIASALHSHASKATRRTQLSAGGKLLSHSHGTGKSSAMSHPSELVTDYDEASGYPPDMQMSQM